MIKIAFSLLLALFFLSTIMEASNSSQTVMTESSIVEVENSTSETSDTKLFVDNYELFDCTCHSKGNIPYYVVRYAFNLIELNFRPPIS